MNELIPINMSDPERITVSARDLHGLLEIGAKYADWFPRMCEYGFEAGRDFNLLKIERVQSEGGRTVTRLVDDAQISIDMAKELCMLQRNERGKLARQYFLQLERDWNSPEKVMARALQIAEKKISTLTADLSKATVQNTIMAPKADYFDELVDRNLLTGIRETAKELGVKQKVFVDFLLDKKYLHRSKSGKLTPTAGKGDGLFEMKECFNEKTSWAGTQVMVTPKGRETFRLLCQGM